MPPDLDQTFSSVRQALAELLHSAAQLGIVPSSYDLTPKEIIEEFYRRDPQGDIDNIYAQVIQDAPSLKQAQAKLEQAQRDLDQAKLDLRYCTIVAEIDGVVTRRNVNPGNNVQVGQSLMAIRSLRDIWVDANFKETQLRDLRIGQRVELEGRHVWRQAQHSKGASPASRWAQARRWRLLPPQNATGNFVKVVQRLPVRIDLVNYDPDKLPLFVGLSVEPSVDLKSAPTGPNAGKFLQELAPARARNEAVSATAAAERGRRRATAKPRAFNPWIVALAVVIPTFMEVLDTTIANVALRYIAGGLSAPSTDSEWVITSYLAANAIILPMSGWLAVRLGQTELFSDLDRGLHARLRPVRHGDEPRNADRVPRAARAGRRRIATLEPGRAARCVSAGKARRGA